MEWASLRKPASRSAGMRHNYTVLEQRQLCDVGWTSNVFLSDRMDWVEVRARDARVSHV